MKSSTSRRSFLQSVGFGTTALGLSSSARAQQKQEPIQGFEDAPTDPDASKGWKPVADRKIRVGIVGYGTCRFGAAFSFQDHPNGDVVAVSDLFPDRCAALAKACRCEKTYPLREQLGKIVRVQDGVWGPYSARLEPKQWLSIDRDDCPALMIHGEGARYTILAWIKRDSERRWQYIAGVWNEAEAERQYALFVNGHRKTDYRTFTRTKAVCQAHAYMSVEGGVTPGNFACFSYATGATRLEEDRWYFLAATYDQQSLKVYVDGKLDALRNCNPFVYPDKPIFDGGEDGANFTVAQRAIPEWKGYPNTPYPDEEQGFSGQIGGLAVYNRALSAAQIATVHAAVEARKLGNN